jgi:hypothetical protein
LNFARLSQIICRNLISDFPHAPASSALLFTAILRSLGLKGRFACKESSKIVSSLQPFSVTMEDKLLHLLQALNVYELGIVPQHKERNRTYPQ